MEKITLDDFVEKLNSNEETKKKFLENPILEMKDSGIEFDINDIGKSDSSYSLLATAPPPPIVEVFWWGYRVRISAEFLKWIAVGGVSVGAVILALAPLLLLLGPLLGVAAAGVVAAFAIYLLTQHAWLLIEANKCGGTVCLEALWLTPTSWKPSCC